MPGTSPFVEGISGMLVALLKVSCTSVKTHLSGAMSSVAKTARIGALNIEEIRGGSELVGL